MSTIKSEMVNFMDELAVRHSGKTATADLSIVDLARGIVPLARFKNSMYIGIDENWRNSVLYSVASKSDNIRSIAAKESIDMITNCIIKMGERVSKYGFVHNEEVKIIYFQLKRLIASIGTIGSLESSAAFDRNLFVKMGVRNSGALEAIDYYAFLTFMFNHPQRLRLTKFLYDGTAYQAYHAFIERNRYVLSSLGNDNMTASIKRTLYFAGIINDINSDTKKEPKRKTLSKQMDAA